MSRGRPRERHWKPSPLATAVELLDGPRFAAAYGEISLEGILQALRRGYLVDGRPAVRLARELERRGTPMPLHKLLGLDDHLHPLPTGSEPTPVATGRRKSTPTAASGRLRVVAEGAEMARFQDVPVAA